MPTQFGQNTNNGPTTTVGSMPNDKCYRSRAEALAEIERECNVRFKCFDRWIKDGKLGEVEARDRLERLISAWHFLADTDQARAMLLTEAKEGAQ